MNVWIAAALGVIIGATAASLFWCRALERYFENEANARTLAAQLKKKGYL